MSGIDEFLGEREEIFTSDSYFPRVLDEHTRSLIACRGVMDLYDVAAGRNYSLMAYLGLLDIRKEFEESGEANRYHISATD